MGFGSRAVRVAIGIGVVVVVAVGGVGVSWWRKFVESQDGVTVLMDCDAPVEADRLTGVAFGLCIYMSWGSAGRGTTKRRGGEKCDREAAQANDTNKMLRNGLT